MTKDVFSLLHLFFSSDDTYRLDLTGTEANLTVAKQAVELAMARLKRGDLQAAERLLKHAVALDPGSPGASTALAALLEEQGRLSAAIDVLTGTARLGHAGVAMLVQLGRLSRSLGDLPAAGHWLERARLAVPDDPAVRIELAALAIECDRPGQVEELLGNLTAVDSRVLAARAQWMSSTGRFAEAEQCLREQLAANPHDAGAFHALSMLPTVTLTARDEDSLHAILRDGSSRRASTHALLALARRAERDGHYESAFRLFSEAKRRQREGLRPQREAYRAMFERHATWQEPEVLEALEPVALSSAKPIWVIGMPRSGTTLVEQMLDAHPQIRGLGEVEYVRVLVEAVEEASGMPFPAGIGTTATSAARAAASVYLSRLSQRAPGASWVIDKLPHNFLRAGILHALCPSGIFVHCRRDAVANCWSVFTHEFADSHDYATDLGALGEYHRLYETLLRKWRDTLGDRLVEVDLETVVRSPREALSPVLSAAGLDWHHGCALPHANPRPVLTPSAVAVRQQVGRSDAAKHLPYLPWLGALTSALGRP